MKLAFARAAKNFRGFHEAEAGEDLTRVQQVDGDRRFRHQMSPLANGLPLLPCRCRATPADRRRAEAPPTRRAPRPPTLLEPREAERDIAGALFERGGRRVIATLRSDHGSRLPMMRRDKMQDELAPVLRSASNSAFFSR